MSNLTLISQIIVTITADTILGSRRGSIVSEEEWDMFMLAVATGVARMMSEMNAHLHEV